MENKNKTILLVDDDSTISGLYKERLEIENYNVVLAENGSEAIEKISTIMPDLILLDIMMPKLGGLDVLEFIKSKEELKKIPVIVFTALSSEDSKIESMIKGADDYVIKTKIAPKELVEKVNKFLGR